jgi:hypothetical protein
MRFGPALILAAALASGGCTDSQGNVDWGSTALLGAGLGAAVALAATSSSHTPSRGYGYDRGYRSSAYGYRGGYRRNYGYGK